MHNRRSPRLALLAALAVLVSVGVAAPVVGAAAPPAPGAKGAPPAVAPRTLLEDPAFTRGADVALAKLYNLDLAGARVDFARLAATYPGHPAGPFLTALPDWWEILLDLSNRSRDDHVLAAMEEVLARADRRLDEDDDDLDGMFFRAAALGVRGRIRSLRSEWIPAAWDGKRALDLVRVVAKQQPQNADLDLALGLYDYYAVVMPERYPIFRALAPFFTRGDRARGLARIDNAMRHGRFASTEAGYFLLEINLFFERNYLRASELATWLHTRHPGNSLFHVYQARAHAQWQMWERAAPILDEVLSRHAAHAPGYVDNQAVIALYFRARCDLGTGQPVQAEHRLAKLEEIAARTGSRSNFRILAELQRGLAADVQGHREAALKRYRRVLELRDVGGSHEVARKFLREPFLWHGRDTWLPG